MLFTEHQRHVCFGSAAAHTGLVGYDATSKQGWWTGWIEQPHCTQCHMHTCLLPDARDLGGTACARAPLTGEASADQGLPRTCPEAVRPPQGSIAAGQRCGCAPAGSHRAPAGAPAPPQLCPRQSPTCPCMPPKPPSAPPKTAAGRACNLLRCWLRAARTCRV